MYDLAAATKPDLIVITGDFAYPIPVSYTHLGMEDIWFATVSSEYTFNLEAVKLRKKVLAPYRSQGQPKDWQETAAGKFRDTCPSNFWDDISVPYWSMPENTAHPLSLIHI